MPHNNTVIAAWTSFEILIIYHTIFRHIILARFSLIWATVIATKYHSMVIEILEFYSLVANFLLTSGEPYLRFDSLLTPFAFYGETHRLSSVMCLGRPCNVYPLCPKPLLHQIKSLIQPKLHVNKEIKLFPFESLMFF